MSVFVDIVNAIVSVQNEVSEFVDTGIYDLLTKFTAWLIQWLTVAWFKAKLLALTFSYSVAQQMLTNLNISSYLTTTYSNLDSQTFAAINFLRIPDAINLMISAAMTKFVYRVLGF
ncbi:DUF2523 domain-containing protein [Methylomonas sp. AM2-LC]|uniref:DUF2523 domain-containing protein n=1 Tax=Methylomonas sp. AM2-LC TaxID=3153301 RepID=UPI0032638766